MRILLGAMLASVASGAIANPAPVIAPAPAWVKRTPVKLTGDKTEAPVRLLLSDQQVQLTPGVISTFGESAAVVQTDAGLAGGNIAVSWRPDVDDITVHALSIIRDGKTIDVLASQKFTVMRRETQLDAATLDGRLTASLLIDGVQVGDIIDLAFSIVSRDPVLAGHVESVGAGWNMLPMEHAHARIHWTKDVPLRVRTSGGLAAVTPASDSTGKFVEITAEKIQPLIPPKGAPLRFKYGRLLEATDYRGWSDIGALMAPLYAKAEAIDAKGDLAHQIDGIRATTPDPLARAAAALDLVQSRVRYVALQMGQGGYVPANADATWSSRLGDCKAKSALLLAILHRLDIKAVPVAASVLAGDGIDERLPLVGLFDHVLVRASVGGRDYYLDGTRLGDKDLARLEMPNFKWGLPLVPAAQLVRIVPSARTQPDNEFALNIDARAGVFAPAKVHAEVTFRGDDAQGVRQSLSQLSGASLDNALREYWKGIYDFVEPASVTSTFDPTTGSERLAFDGTGKLKWNDNWLRVPGSSLAYAADFARPAGPNQDAPFALDYPRFSREITTIQLPPGIALWPGKVGHDIDQTLAGVAYHREAKLDGNVLRMVKTQRAVVPEIDAASARAAQAKLRALDDEDVQLLKNRYAGTDADVAALKATMPDTASAYFERGLVLLNRGKYRDAIADFTAANQSEPGSAWYLANRGIAHVWLSENKEAEEDFASVDKLALGNPVAARGRALIALRKGDASTALSQIDTSLKADPDNLFAINLRVQANHQLGKDDEALADTEKLLAVEPGNAEVRLLRANIYKVAGKNDLALAEGEAIQRANPKDVGAQVTAAMIYSALHKTGRAMSAFDQALAIKPSSFIYLNRRNARDRADVEGRRADVEMAMKLSPDDPEVLWAAASIAMDAHDYRGAANLYSKGLVGNKNPAFTLVARGVALAKLGDLPGAEKDFIAAAAADKSSELANALCWNKAIHDVVLSSALQDCDRALASSPNSSHILDSRGMVNLKLGRLDAAIADYTAAVKAYPKQTSSWYGRSVARSRKGDLAGAKADRAAAEAIDPDIVDTYRKYGIDPVSGTEPAPITPQKVAGKP